MDSSAVWRLQRQPELAATWTPLIVDGAVGSCEPQRAEFRRSARNVDEFNQMNRMYRIVYPDVPVLKTVWRWVDSAQYRLAAAGAARALSLVGLLVCGVAASQGLVVLHDDADYELAEHILPRCQLATGCPDLTIRR